MLKVLNIVFRVRYRVCVVLVIISFMPFMFLPSTFLHTYSPIIDAQASLSAEPINLSNSTTNSYSPQLAISNSRTLGGNESVYVVWSDNAAGNGDIYFKRSADNGTSFGDTENLSNNSAYPDSFHMAVSGSSVYVVWSDNATGNG